MKFSDKMLLIKAGASFSEIKQMEEEESKEIEESKKHEKSDPEPEKKDPDVEPEKEQKEILSSLEAATEALKKSKEELSTMQAKYEKLNEDYLKLTNSKTVKEENVKTGADVFAELFNTKKEKEDKK